MAIRCSGTRPEQVKLPELLMKERVYRNLQQKMLALILVASLAPLLILGTVLYYQFEQTGREMTLEYCLLAGVNDQPAQAAQLATIARDLDAHVNLLIYNPVQGLPFERPSRNRAVGFLHELRRKGARAHLRESRGLEADAACGQLRRRKAAG